MKRRKNNGPETAAMRLERGWHKESADRAQERAEKAGLTGLARTLAVDSTQWGSMTVGQWHYRVSQVGNCDRYADWLIAAIGEVHEAGLLPWGKGGFEKVWDAYEVESERRKRRQVPCPYVDADGKGCAGHIVRVKAQTDLEWIFTAEAPWPSEPNTWSFSVEESRPDYRLFCSTEEGDLPSKHRPTCQFDELPAVLKKVVVNSLKKAKSRIEL